MKSYQINQVRRRQRIDLLLRFLESNPGEFVNKILAKFRMETGTSNKTSQEYLQELILTDTVSVTAGRIDKKQKVSPGETPSKN